jgi:hypothetical protein
MSGSGIFEIREYLDSDGKIEKHDVVDISQELDFISKMCSAVGGEGTEQESELNVRTLWYVFFMTRFLVTVRPTLLV